MSEGVQLDHLEIHVRDVPRYCDFLVALFRGGAWRVLDAGGVAMYRTPDGAFFELKPRAVDGPPARSGVCLPCLRMPDPLDHLAALGLTVVETAENASGRIHFFTDHEGVEWHVKDYPRPDPALDW